MAGARTPKLGRMAADMDKIDDSRDRLRADHFHESSLVTFLYVGRGGYVVQAGTAALGG